MESSEIRMAARKDEYEASRGKEEEQGDVGSGEGGMGLGDNGAYGGAGGADIEEIDAQILAAEENSYKELEAKFIEQLQLTEDDLPEGFDLSRVGGGGEE